MASLGDRVRQKNDAIRAGIKKNVDDPLDLLRARLSGAFDGPQPRDTADHSRDIPIPPNGDDAMPNNPNMAPADQQMRTNAMIAAAENMQRLKEKETAMRRGLEAEDAAANQREAEFDMSQYKPVPKPGQEPVTPPSRFGNLQAKMAGQQPMPQPQEPMGAIELSEDPEIQARQIAEARARAGR